MNSLILSLHHFWLPLSLNGLSRINYHDLRHTQCATIKMPATTPIWKENRIKTQTQQQEKHYCIAYRDCIYANRLSQMLFLFVERGGPDFDNFEYQKTFTNLRYSIHLY